MASNKKLCSILYDVHCDSDDSDQEFVSGKTIEELEYELDVARYYRTFVRKNFIEFSSSKPCKKRISKAVQTDPDVSGIPSSWIFAGQKLVDELYTGLGNMINTLYHTPNGYRKEESMEKEPVSENVKVSKNETGCWNSKLHSQFGVPITSQLHSDGFTKDLNHLLETATKLKNVIPCLIEVQQRDPPENGPEIIRESANSSSNKTEADKAVTVPVDDLCAHLREYDSNKRSVKCGKNGFVEAHLNNRTAKRCESNSTQCGKASKPISKGNFLKNILSQNTDPEHIQNDFTTHEKIENSSKSMATTSDGKNSVVDGHGDSSCRINAAASCDNRSKTIKICNSKVVKGGKTECIFNNGKNFIKRNILASKFPAHRATTSKSAQDQQFQPEKFSQGMGQVKRIQK